MITRVSIAVTTDTGGDATEYSTPVSGRLLAIAYVPDGTSPLDTGADIVVSGGTTGVAILTKANIGTSAVTWHPRGAAVAATDGSALVYSTANPVATEIPVCNEAIKIVVANGDDTKSGTFYCFIEGIG